MATVGEIPFSRPWIAEQDIDEVVAVLRSGWWTSGPLVREFEQRFAEYVGTGYAVALNSCTAALHVALVAAGVGPGDLVVTTTWTFAATAEVAAYLGAIPVLLDVEPETLNLSASQFRALCECLASGSPAQAVSDAVHDGALPPGTARALQDGSSIERLKAVIPVHFAGCACDMDDIAAVAGAYGVPIIEDAAHAVETTYRGKHAGTLGTIGTFSFYATKNLSTGEGGMATTDDAALADRMRSLSLHGISRDAWKRYTAAGSWRYDIQEPGFKYNMTDMAAALGLGQLARIAELQGRRREIVQSYARGLSDIEGLTLPADSAVGEHAWHLYVLRVAGGDGSSRRDSLIEGLRTQGIGTSVHFIPLHRHSYYCKRFGYLTGDFPEADLAFDQVVSLPLYPSLTDDEVERVCTSVRQLMNGPVHGG